VVFISWVVQRLSTFYRGYVYVVCIDYVCDMFEGRKP